MGDFLAMRLTSGRFKGRNIKAPPGNRVRPTTSLVRESVFSRLGADISGVRFLDAFAGSGLMGFEALSRGAGYVLAIEKERRHHRGLVENARQLGCTEAEYLPLCADAVKLAAKPCQSEPFDVVFIDPPYGTVDLPALCEALKANRWLGETALLVMEHGLRDPVPDGADSRKHGDTVVSFLSV